MNKSHTPTPWRVDGADIVSPSECAVVATVQWCGEGRDGESDANAAHIVRCVNAYDDLVAALTAAQEFLQTCHVVESAGRRYALGQVNAALAKAGAL